MTNIRKLLLGLFVSGLFVVYSIYGRTETRSTQSGAVADLPDSGGSGIGSDTMPIVARRYKDGTYIGDASDALYGYVQVQAVIRGGKITDVIFLKYPSDRSTSREINNQAMPDLKREAIQAQSAQVDGVSGATDSSQAFIQSLGSALQKAQA